MSKYSQALEAARKEFEKKPNWIDFKNMFFSQDSPYIPKTKEERKEYINSPEYKEIRALCEQLEEEQLDVDKPQYSGRILVRVGPSLHKSLMEEAAEEEMSLNQLILAKLAPPLYDRVRGRK